MLWIDDNSAMLWETCVDFLKYMCIKNMYKKLTIPKLQDIFDNICKVSDSEHNKKETLL